MDRNGGKKYELNKTLPCESPRGALVKKRSEDGGGYRRGLSRNRKARGVGDLRNRDKTTSGVLHCADGDLDCVDVKEKSYGSGKKVCEVTKGGPHQSDRGGETYYLKSVRCRREIGAHATIIRPPGALRESALGGEGSLLKGEKAEKKRKSRKIGRRRAREGLEPAGGLNKLGRSPELNSSRSLV